MRSLSGVAILCLAAAVAFGQASQPEPAQKSAKQPANSSAGKDTKKSTAKKPQRRRSASSKAHPPAAKPLPAIKPSSGADVDHIEVIRGSQRTVDKLRIGDAAGAEKTDQPGSEGGKETKK